jgi:hypothetical protein
MSWDPNIRSCNETNILTTVNVNQLNQRGVIHQPRPQQAVDPRVIADMQRAKLQSQAQAMNSNHPRDSASVSGRGTPQAYTPLPNFPNPNASSGQIVAVRKEDGRYKELFRG